MNRVSIFTEDPVLPLFGADPRRTTRATTKINQMKTYIEYWGDFELTDEQIHTLANAGDEWNQFEDFEND